MRSGRPGGWLVLLALGYLCFYAIWFAEMAYALPRELNTDTLGMAAAWFHRLLEIAPLRAFAEGPCQALPHLSSSLLAVALGLLSLGYLGAVRAVQRRPEAWSLPGLLGWAGLAALPLLLLLPPTSADALSYLFFGRVLSVYGMSPWHHTLAEFPAEQGYLSPAVWGAELRCAYGPVWVAVMAALTGAGWLLAPGDLGPGSLLLNLLLLRLANVAALGAAAFAVWKLNGLFFARQQRLVTAALLLNPLVVYEGVGALHNDLWGMAFLLWACYLFLKEDRRFVLPLVLAILTKVVALALVPPLLLVLLRARDGRGLGLAVAGVTAALGLVALTATGYVSGRLGASTDDFQLSAAALPPFLAMLLSLAGETAPYRALVLGTARVLGVLFIPLYLALVGRARTRQEAVACGAAALGVFFAGAYLQTMPWYYLWPLGLLCALPWDRARANLAAASVAVLASYLFLLWHHNSGDAGFNPWTHAAGTLLPLATATAAWAAGRAGGWSAWKAMGEEAGAAGGGRRALRGRTGEVRGRGARYREQPAESSSITVPAAREPRGGA